MSGSGIDSHSPNLVISFFFVTAPEEGWYQRDFGHVGHRYCVRPAS
jgi:hypothetical protein